jgi:hypothetical protein
MQSKDPLPVYTLSGLARYFCYRTYLLADEFDFPKTSAAPIPADPPRKFHPSPRSTHGLLKDAGRRGASAVRSEN